MGLFSFNKPNPNAPQWVDLKDERQLNELIKESHEIPVVFFKHSTRCGISAMAKNGFEAEWDLTKEEIIPVYLDLLAHRNLSNELASKFGITHQSPQIILVKEGKSIYDASHHSISVDAIKKRL